MVYVERVNRKGIFIMKAIQIKYLGATNTKGARLKAFTDAGSIIEPRDYRLNSDQQARAMAFTYCQQHDWPMPTGFGTLPNGDHVATI